MEAILTELETHWGLEKYKAKVFGLTLDGLRKKYTRLINEAKTLEEELGFTDAVQREILPPEFRRDN